jgi:hypothetical protein
VDPLQEGQLAVALGAGHHVVQNVNALFFGAGPFDELLELLRGGTAPARGTGAAHRALVLRLELCIRHDAT